MRAVGSRDRPEPFAGRRRSIEATTYPFASVTLLPQQCHRASRAPNAWCSRAFRLFRSLQASGGLGLRGCLHPGNLLNQGGLYVEGIIAREPSTSAAERALVHLYRSIFIGAQKHHWQVATPKLATALLALVLSFSRPLPFAERPCSKAGFNRWHLPACGSKPWYAQEFPWGLSCDFIDRFLGG